MKGFSFFDSILVLKSIGDDDSSWLFSHVFDTAIALIQKIDFFLEALDFELTVAFFEFASLHAALEILELADLLVDGFDVSKHTTNPTNGHIRHLNRLGGLFDDVFHLLFGTDEEDLFALSDDTSDLWEILVESLNGLLEVDNMGAFALTVDIWSHLWVPTAGLVTKMCTSSKKLFDVCLYRHNNLSASLSYESCFVNLYY